MFQKRLSDENIRNDERYSSNANPFVASNYGMPNCTCYCYGRAWEVTGNKPVGLSLHNAVRWFEESTGFEKGQEPRLGAIACFGGKYGHVASVEEIHADGTVILSNSNFGGDFFFIKTVADIINWGYPLLGYIYVYTGEDAVPNFNTPKQSVEEVAMDISVGRGDWGDNPVRREKLQAAGYDATAVQNRVNEILAGNAAQSSVSYLNLSDVATSWSVYNMGVQPVKKNRCGALAPNRFGGLTYVIQGYTMPNVAIINTQTYGQVQIYIGPELSNMFSITDTPVYEVRG